MHRIKSNKNRMSCLVFAALGILGLQISMPAKAVLSCSRGGEVDVSEYLEAPSSRIKGPFEEWVQSEVNTLRALIETQAADFNPETAENTFDDLTRTLGASRNRLARTQYPADKAEFYGRPRGLIGQSTPFFGPENIEGQTLSYAEVAYAKQSQIGESLKTLYETETEGDIKIISYQTQGVVRVEGADEVRLSVEVPLAYSNTIESNLKSSITWVNFSGEDDLTYYVYRKKADGAGLVLIYTGDSVLQAGRAARRNARIWSRIKRAWSEALGAPNQSVFYRKVSDFAWLYAHHQPYQRGSASILEVKLWALFASNGYKVELYDKHIDLHALSTMRQEDFNLAPLLGL